MTEAEIVDIVGKALADAASSPARVYLFGSRATGTAEDNSDFDFLVVERHVPDRFAEAVHLSRVLGRLRVPGDVVVVGQEQFEAWRTVGGTLMHDASREGRVIADSWAA